MSNPEIRTYGNWRQPESPGIAGFGLAGTLVVVVGLVLAIVSLMVSTKLALVVVVLSLVVLVPLLVRDRHGRNGMQWLSARLSWARGKSMGQHLYRSGPLGCIPRDTCMLPGLVAASVLREEHDVYGRPFALLSMPSTDHHTVVLTCRADGAALVDSHQVDIWVAYWGQWLASLAHEPRLVSVSVTVETAPDSGERLRREVADHLDESAPELARQVLGEITREYPTGSAEITTRIALTYTAAGGELGVRRSVSEMVEEIGTRLPGVAGGLAMTGAGPARPMTAAELAELVRVAYDPTSAALMDEARPAGGSGLSWDQAGPVGAEEEWDSYRHDGAASITWAMSEAPRGEVFSTVLSRMVAPHPDMVRKRVTLVYRPYDVGQAARLVERDRKDALFKAQQRRMAQARDSLSVRDAEQSAREEATGAGLLRFGLLVTATVLDPADLKRAAAAVDNLASSSRVRLRRVYGAQATAFVAALPLGLVLTDHARVPTVVRNAM